MHRYKRNRRHGEEEESVFVTMTDMTISFLLIIMILLAFFATQINEEGKIPVSVYEKIQREREKLEITNKEINSSITEIMPETVRLQDEMNKLQGEVDKLQITNKEMNSIITEIIPESVRLQVEVNKLQSEINKLKGEVNKLQVLNRLLQSRNFNFGRMDRITSENLRAQSEYFNGEIIRLKKLNEKLSEINPLEIYNSESDEQRRKILVKIRDRLLIEFPDLEVVISPEQDALRFQGEGLFRSGSSELDSQEWMIVKTLGNILDDILGCFTLGERARRGPDCNSENALIEAIQIEGHTDHDGSDAHNLGLSTDRANATLLVILDDDKMILEHKNIRGQPVMSVSGYGEMRPIETNNTIEGKSANRRIDLRIIMYSPNTIDEVNKIHHQFNELSNRVILQ